MSDTVNVLERQEMKQPRRSVVMARAVVITAAALLGGCANVHNVEVGSIPDDYRTTHPIIVGEKETAINVPVATHEKKLNYGRVSIVRGFAAEYRENSSGPVQIMTPVGSPNSASASSVAGQIKKILVKEGVPAGRIGITPYQAAAQNDAAPVRLSFTAIGAHTNQCGKWPEDLTLNTLENKHYHNFGCASQNNLAAQIANPSDLLAPRGMTPIDAQRRDKVIENYRNTGSYATDDN